ncbi:MAG TPA: epoxide hydrolase [Myxococcaceae bacterium]|nr:epoxide hydrolase [Myxococcaceae bacterium]
MSASGVVEPFRANVSEQVLADLRERLAATRWPEAVSGVGWSEGVDQAWLRRVVMHWETRFDWRVQEARLNAFPQFLVRVGGTGVHCIHARGRGPRPVPLVITHGWPGSVFEMLRLVPMLTDPAAHGGATEDSFDVVVPSIPGYGFSDRPTSPGMSNAAVAELWIGMMEALGYPRFAAQGGDWGAGISTWIARKAPERLIGLHLNYIPGSFRPWVEDEGALSSEERGFLAEKALWGDEEGAYGHVQATRPGTLGVALTDSPAGLAAWILEKVRAWADCDGDPESRFTLDELLANVTLYWVTNTAASSIRLYRESKLTPLQLGPGERIRVPMGFAHFPLEAPAPPRRWVERGYEVRRWTEMPRGGHFAAWEEPELIARDIREFFRPLRGV